MKKVERIEVMRVAVKEINKRSGERGFFEHSPTEKSSSLRPFPFFSRRGENASVVQVFRHTGEINAQKLGATGVRV